MRKTSITLLVLTLFWFAPPPAGASSLRNDVLLLLPRQSGEVAFVDLIELRRSPHYRTIKQRMIPERFTQFETFVRSVGIDVDTDLDWLAWVLVPPEQSRPEELFLGIAQGRFEVSKVEEYFSKQKLPVDVHRGQKLFPFGAAGESGTLAFTFLDGSTGVFGTRASLELLLETRFGGNENVLRNEVVSSRIGEVNGRQPLWVVLDEHYTRMAVRQLTPEAAKFPEFEQLSQRLKSSLIQAEVGREVSLNFQTWCADPTDALTFSLLLQAGLMVQGGQLQKNNPALSSVLQRVDVSSSGERLQVRLTAGEEELRNLLQGPLKVF